jgi:hypothetical protein
MIARFAGIRPGSASPLLALAVPLVMQVLGSQRAAVGQSPAALTSLLGEQRDLLGRWLPAGLASMPGWLALAPTAPEVPIGNAHAARRALRDPARVAMPTPSDRGTGWRWLVPLLIVGFPPGRAAGVDAVVAVLKVRA